MTSLTALCLKPEFDIHAPQFQDHEYLHNLMLSIVVGALIEGPTGAYQINAA